MNALAYAIQLLSALPPLIAAGRDVSAMLANSTALLEKMQAEGRVPTAAEWDALNATIKALRDELHAP